MTVQQPEAHIKEPYALAGIKAKIASNDYNAEMLLQHSMLLLDGAALSANVGEPTKAQIREVLMSHGFTVKEGQTDLKQYVYDAAYALLALAAPQHTQAAPAAQGDAEDAARYRWLKSQASENLLNPRAALSEICPDMRTHWKLPTLICSGPVGGYLDFDASIDAARSQVKEVARHG